MPSLILFNKPFGVLSQFRDDDNNEYATLSEYFDDKGLRVAGRLDATSEGLLLLTDSGQLNHLLTKPKLMMPNTVLNPNQGKTYWVQVEGRASDSQLKQLQDGVILKDGKTLPALVDRLGDDDIDKLWQAPANIAKRQNTTWLAITLFEGKNRQIRRMTAHVGLPCLRLVRVASHGYSVHGIDVGRFVRVFVSDKKMKALSAVG